MVTEIFNTTPEEENLTGEIAGELSNLEWDVIDMNQPKKDIHDKAIDTEYHNPEMDQFRFQQFSNDMEKYTYNGWEMSERDKKALSTELKLSLPSLKNRADELVEKNLATLSYIKRIKDNINPSIKDIVEEKLMEDTDFTNNVIKKYEDLNWKEKPDFFPFFCACKWYEKLEVKPKNGCLAIVDFSTTTEWNSVNKAKKAGDWRVNEGKLFLMNMNTNEITLTVDKSPQWWWGEEYSEVWAWFSNASGSLKSSLWFTQVAISRPVDWKKPKGPWKNIPPEISLEGSTGPHVVLAWLENGINDNTTIRQMYAHGWTYSEWCTVVYSKEERQIFLNSLIWRDLELPVENGGKWNSRGVIFTYSSNEGNYLKESRYLA